ncbi:hypothetical protein [Yunchengibacter salinarum]|uniref:hypothetical protein n=1 Tax=Yunchengibacter salinarum TaxID=3133399 RepID=UPI0035B5ADEC
MEALYFLFMERPYGAILLGALLWLALRPFRHRIGRRVPVYVAATVVILGGCVLPSLPRYQYETRIRDMAAYSPEMVLRETRRERFLLEPVTWINPPATRLVYSGPREPFAPDAAIRRFRVERYDMDMGHKPRRLDIDCANDRFKRQVTDRAGRFFEDGQGNRPLSDQMREFYCLRDWRAEVAALEGAADQAPDPMDEGSDESRADKKDADQ